MTMQTVLEEAWPEIGSDRRTPPWAVPCNDNDNDDDQPQPKRQRRPPWASDGDNAPQSTPRPRAQPRVVQPQRQPRVPALAVSDDDSSDEAPYNDNDNDDDQPQPKRQRRPPWAHDCDDGPQQKPRPRARPRVIQPQRQPLVPVCAASDDDSNDSSMDLRAAKDMETRVTMQTVLEEVWPEIGSRIETRHVGLNYDIVPGKPVIRISIAHLCADRRSDRCSHTGKGPAIVHHGTKSAATAQAIIEEGGFMKDATPDRTLKNMAGWYHSQDVMVALQYARVTRIDCFRVRLVFVIASACRNSCKNGRKWQYTRSGCRRYHIIGLLLIPEQWVRHVDVL